MKLESVPEMGYLTEDNQGTNDFQSRRHIFVLFLCSPHSHFVRLFVIATNDFMHNYLHFSDDISHIVLKPSHC